MKRGSRLVAAIATWSLVSLGWLGPLSTDLSASGLSIAEPRGAATDSAAKAEKGEKADDSEHAQTGEKSHGAHGSQLSDERIPLQLDGFPKRPKPILELGEHFLGTGTLGNGLELPTGAVWQPQFLLFGALRTALQSFDRGSDTVTEAAARLDLFGNLQLSGTERLVVAFRNLDREGRFTRYQFGDGGAGGSGEGFEDELNARVQGIFFEGDFGEIFPNLSRRDFSATDWGFSIGRQPLLFQEGLLINDSIDGIGITRNTLLPSGTSNFRMTYLFAWNNIHRTDRSQARSNVTDRSARLYGLLTSTDFRWSTMDIDAAYLSSDFGDLATVGLSAVQRIGKTNSSFRLVSSWAPGGETALATDGTLALAELSWTPKRTHDLMYVNGFAAINDFTSVSRDPSTGGPLGRAGINFAAVGLGSYGAPLSNQARDVAGGAVGYQKFWNETRSQVIFELGARVGLENDVRDQGAFTTRFQQAIKRHFVVIVDGFVGYREALIPGASSDTLVGGRLELLTKF